MDFYFSAGAFWAGMLSLKLCPSISKQSSLMSTVKGNFQRPSYFELPLTEFTNDKRKLG